MFLLKNLILPKKMGILIFVKISAFMILTRICYLCNELGLNNNILNKAHYSSDKLGVRTDRLLAKGELANKNLHANLLNKASDYRDNRKMKNGSDNIKIYSQLGKNNLSKLELYRKDYKKRYNKKNGIAKLECYCEKKAFDKFEHICSLVNKSKNEKTNVKKRTFKKYAIPIILLSLFSIFGLIMPIIFSDYNPLAKDWCYSDCTSKHEATGNQLTVAKAHEVKLRTMIPIDSNTWSIMNTLNFIYLYVTLFIALFMSIYIFYKIIKYEGLKAGKSKMSAKEYYRMIKSNF